jgi:hypothetical protein
MLPAVQQDVDERVPNLTRRSQRAAVISVGPDVPGTSEPAVDCLRESDPESLHPAYEGPRPVRLDQQMDVVRLHGELHDAKIEAPACGEGVVDRAGDRSRP